MNFLLGQTAYFQGRLLLVSGRVDFCVEYQNIKGASQKLVSKAKVVLQIGRVNGKIML